MNDLIQTVAVYALPVLFAITLHEAAHAYAAKFFGDNTAYSMGRMSLNPIRHIDPLGTILIPVMLYFATSGAFLFGYAKPVPINYSHLRKPRRDSAWVAFAGPGANFVMALMWALVGIGLFVGGVQEEFFSRMVRAGILTNLVMFAFNLFPIPPLDGGRIVTSLLPSRQGYQFAQLERYGFFIIMALVLLKVMYTWWIEPIMYLSGILLNLIIYPLTLLLH